MLKILTAVSVLVAIFLSCKKSTPENNAGEPAGFSNIFEVFWNQMNVRYSYWDADTVDWDRVYKQYKPLFDTLDINKEADNRQAYHYFLEMTTPFLDGHFSITFSNRFLSNFIIYPSYQKKQHEGFFPVNYLTADTAYLDDNYTIGYDERTVINGRPLYAICGLIDGEIIYFSCNSFGLYNYYTSSQYNAIKPVLQHLFDWLHNPAIKGIIIDVRNNPGGDVKDLNLLAGHLTLTNHIFGFARYKTGNDRLNFTPWLESFINPVPNTTDFKKAKVVLTDRYSASLSELMAMAIRSLPNSTIVGDTTWGATGFITNGELYNAGSFEVKDFMKVTLSSGTFKYIDNRLYEGVGFPPDVQISSNTGTPNIVNDKTLEKAINIIKSNP